MKILVTGGAGYIGAHTCLAVLEQGYEVVVYDNFSNGHVEALRRVQRLAGRTLDIVRGDIQDRNLIRKTLQEHRCGGVIHFAGLKAVGDSVSNPLSFYNNNVFGTISLLDAMEDCNVRRLVFSSSATVYGDPRWLPITENHPLRALNPYGRTKLMIEDVLRDLYASDPSWSIGILRYFNPVGAHSSGEIGEDPKGVPTNLMPYIAQVASGLRSSLKVFGDDYPTLDGTGERDYLHVVDLAEGHIAALKVLEAPTLFEVNLGTGNCSTVLEMVDAFARASGRDIPVEHQNRRAGDAASCFADASKALELLGWRAWRDIDTMCRDHWNWQSRNPEGYQA
ncbi:UDP-glucose 4-epimerase GalE (plasmid) [Rhodobacteraceae bacterium M382]|nr:UDP-glucose 4-epimerase GalE [Rhodobacteraceae bacterium M382]